MNIQETPIDDRPDGYEPEVDEAWLEEIDELPPRPRRKLLAPLPIALGVVLGLALAFFGGIEVEKSQSGSSTSNGLPAGLAALSSGGRSSSGAPSGAGFPGAGGLGGGLTTGEVSYVDGTTLYVTTGEGGTVKVHSPSGTKVSKTVSTSVKSIHPGDTVVVRGSQAKSGSITASSISISSSGSGSSGTSGTSTGSGSGSSQQLFGSG